MLETPYNLLTLSGCCRYLWVKGGRAVTADSFSTTFESLMSKYCSFKIKPQAYRQAAVAISREYIPPHLHVEGSNLVEEKPGHSEGMGHSHYAISADDIPFLTQDTVFIYRRIDSYWHNVTGCGKEPPPRPLRLISLHQPLPSPSLQDFEGVMNKSIAAALNNVQEDIVKKLVPAIVQEVTDSLKSPAVTNQSNQATLDESPASSLPPSSMESYMTDGLVGDSSGIVSSETSNHGSTSTSNPFSYSEASTESSGSSWHNDASSISVIDITDSEGSSQPTTQDTQPPRQPWRRNGREVVRRSDSHVTPAQKSSNNKLHYPYGRVLVPPTSDDWDSDTYLIDEARRGIRLLFPSDPHASEKSPEQLEYLVHVLERKVDLVVVLPTGSGKSLGWQVAAMVEPSTPSIIISPYEALLTEQLESSRKKGILAQRFTATGPPLQPGVQNIFVQLETMVSHAYKK